MQRLQNAVEAGEDLTKYLSLDPQTRGISPQGGWSDKDLILNIMGFHHFHLGPETRRYRSDELALARVSREEFEVMDLFDHDVFEPGTSERSRLHTLHEFAYLLNPVRAQTGLRGS
jgi:hypothetical protein